MRHAALLALSLLPVCASAKAPPTTFIPYSPLNAEEAAAYLEKVKKYRIHPDAQLDELKKEASEQHTYRVSDIVKAFPQLAGARKLSECSNRIMSGATALVFYSDVKEHEVTFKTLDCSPVDKGLQCKPIRREKKYFLESPEHAFLLEKLTFETAKAIVEAYKAGGLDAAPDWWPPGFRPDAQLIEALPDGNYRLFFGDYLCAGCVSSFNVSLDTSAGDPRLVYRGQADGGCF